MLKEKYNQIEYGRKELTKMLSLVENEEEIKEKKKKKKTKVSSKISRETDTENFIKSMDFVEKIAREKLIRWIKENFIRDLINSPVML